MQQDTAVYIGRQESGPVSTPVDRVYGVLMAQQRDTPGPNDDAAYNIAGFLLQRFVPSRLS